jgi:hypothetical protein
MSGDIRGKIKSEERQTWHRIAAELVLAAPPERAAHRQCIPRTFRLTMRTKGAYCNKRESTRKQARTGKYKHAVLKTGLKAKAQFSATKISDEEIFNLSCIPQNP